MSKSFDCIPTAASLASRMRQLDAVLDDAGNDADQLIGLDRLADVDLEPGR